MSEVFDEYRDNYNSVVQDSIDFSGLPHDFFMQAKADKLADVIARHFTGRERKSLDYLDVGCGVGAFHPFVKNWFGSISGCDISSQSVSRATAENPFGTYTHYDGHRLPYADNSFDVLTTICVVHHVPPAQWPDFFAEMQRVTKPGGIACVIEHNPLNPGTRLAVARCPFDDDAVLLTHWKAQKLARGAGFDAADSEYFLLLPSAKHAARAVEKSLRAVPAGAQYMTIAKKNG